MSDNNNNTAPTTNVQQAFPAVGQQFLYSQGAPTSVAASGAQQLQQSQYIGSVQVQGASVAPVKGESRIEYVPYEKAVIEYEPVERIEYVAREKKVVDHYAVEYQTEYIPQVFQDRYIEYVPVERVVERVEYKAVQRQIVHQPQPEVVQTVAPTVSATTFAAPVTQLTASNVRQVAAPVAAPLTTSYVLQGGYPAYTYAFPGQQVVQTQVKEAEKKAESN
jgi:hypothetical protein